jgi:hypothetical protein
MWVKYAREDSELVGNYETTTVCLRTGFKASGVEHFS